MENSSPRKNLSYLKHFTLGSSINSFSKGIFVGFEMTQVHESLERTLLLDFGNYHQTKAFWGGDKENPGNWESDTDE